MRARKLDTCAEVFDGVTLLVDFTLVDVGPSPTSSTAARTLSILDPTAEMARVHDTVYLYNLCVFPCRNDVSDCNTTWCTSSRVAY